MVKLKTVSFGQKVLRHWSPQLECLADRAEAELKKLMHLREEKDRKADCEDRHVVVGGVVDAAPVTIMSAEKR